MTFLATLRRLRKLATTGAGLKELCAAHAAERRSQAPAATGLKGEPHQATASTSEPEADGSDIKRRNE